ncbi:hypothetical protein ABQF34_12830 [Mycolicibacterium boenickei]
MALEADWTVFPCKGLGKLEFGMSAAQVDTLSDTYGAVTGRTIDRIPDDILRDTLATFGDAMSEEEKHALIAVYAESAQSADSVTETRGDPGLILSYQADRLVEIMPARKQRPLFLDGRDIFALRELEPLALLERLNESPGRYADTEAAFDNLAISLDGFCVTDPDTGVRTLEETDERFQERTVALRQSPYVSEREIDRFIIHSFIGSTS